MAAFVEADPLKKQVSCLALESVVQETLTVPGPEGPCCTGVRSHTSSDWLSHFAVMARRCFLLAPLGELHIPRFVWHSVKGEIILEIRVFCDSLAGYVPLVTIRGA